MSNNNPDVIKSEKTVLLKGLTAVLVVTALLSVSACVFVITGKEVASQNDKKTVFLESYETLPDLEQGAGGVEDYAQDLVVSSKPSETSEEVSNELASDSEVSEPDSQELKVIVRSGDSLHRIFSRLGLSSGILFELSGRFPDARFMKRIYPGDTFEIELGQDGELRSLSYSRNAIDFTSISKNEKGNWELKAYSKPIRVEESELSFEVRSSFYLAARIAGLKEKEIHKITEVFQWDVDFSRDISEGDKFELVMAQQYVDEEMIGDRKPVAIRYTSGDTVRDAYYFKSPEGVEGYYDSQGNNLRKAFLKAPLEYSYISSSFKPRRFHPILKRYQAHNGTDFRAHKGTPVYAAGDGVVSRAGYNRYNGNYVFIKHGTQYVTKYLHFSKKAVTKGQRVEQGQIIGYVGSTGMAEAPHLHYEFLVNGKHVNPRTVKIPQANPVPDSIMPIYQASIKDYFNESLAVASRNKGGASDDGRKVSDY